ncbi:MAG: hypothetical protein COS40_14320 [Deltaproteobacteria bacterium CG03_land_8_20_14_0_80_45_14]|nr:MAG: hypothetical protein COS40_14320 [Deltaproteobacteria bacterium CG03_land_8_20_14_0_80_45_14]
MGTGSNFLENLRKTDWLIDQIGFGRFGVKARKKPWGSSIGNSVLTWSHRRRICYVLGVPTSLAKPYAPSKKKKRRNSANFVQDALSSKYGIANQR